MSNLSVLKTNHEDSLKKYHVVFRDGSRAVVRARSFYISEVYTYCFSSEVLEEMDKKLRGGKAPHIVYEISKRDIFSICEDGAVEITKKPRAVRAKKPVKKPVRAKKKA